MSGLLLLPLLAAPQGVRPALAAEAAVPGAPGGVTIELSQWAGKWYEIARLPNRFEDNSSRDCEGVSSVYTLRPDHTLQIINRCENQKDGGRVREAEGHAYPTNSTNMQLRVSFIWPFYGDYWVFGIAPNHDWVVVGDPRRRYLWIMSRQPTLSDADYARATQIAAEQGFDISRLHRTRQPPQ